MNDELLGIKGPGELKFGMTVHLCNVCMYIYINL